MALLHISFEDKQYDRYDNKYGRILQKNKMKLRFYWHSNARLSTLSSSRKRRYMPSMLIDRADLMPGGVNNLKIVANSALVTSGRFIDREGEGKRGRSRSRDRKISHSAQSPPRYRAESRTVNFTHAFPNREIDAISRTATGCVHYHPRTVPRARLTPAAPTDRAISGEAGCSRQDAAAGNNR